MGINKKLEKEIAELVDWIFTTEEGRREIIKRIWELIEREKMKQ